MMELEENQAKAAFRAGWMAAFDWHFDSRYGSMPQEQAIIAAYKDFDEEEQE